MEVVVVFVIVMVVFVVIVFSVCDPALDVLALVIGCCDCVGLVNFVVGVVQLVPAVVVGDSPVFVFLSLSPFLLTMTLV